MSCFSSVLLFCSFLTLLCYYHDDVHTQNWSLSLFAVQRLFNFNCSPSRVQFMMARAEQESFTDPLKFEELLFTLPQAFIPTFV